VRFSPPPPLRSLRELRGASTTFLTGLRGASTTFLTGLRGASTTFLTGLRGASINKNGSAFILLACFFSFSFLLFLQLFRIYGSTTT